MNEIASTPADVRFEWRSIVRNRAILLAGVVLCGACSVPGVHDFEAASVSHGQKAVFGKIAIRENNEKDVTDRCHLWLRRSDFGLKLIPSHQFAQVVDANEDGLYELTCGLDGGTVKYQFQHLKYPSTSAGTKTYIGDIQIALFPTEDDYLEHFDKTGAALRALWPVAGSIHDLGQDEHYGTVAISVTDESRRAFAGYDQRYGRDNLKPVTALLEVRKGQQ